jgi:hypothetical protein
MSKKITYEAAMYEALEEVSRKEGSLGNWLVKLVEDMPDFLNLGSYARAGLGLEDLQKITEQGKEQLKDRVVQLMLNSKELQETVYTKLYQRFQALVMDGKTWEEVLEEVAIDDNDESEIYVRLVEEHTGRSITSPRDLLEATKLDKSNKERQEELEELYYQAVTNRYEAFLEALLKGEGTYNDLLLVKPRQFGLPDTWTVRGREYNQTKVIYYAIAYVFNMSESFFIRPTLRDIAQEIQAPYSVIMDVYEEVNGWRHRN